MSLSNFEEVKKLNVDQLNQDLLFLKKELFSLRIKQSIKKKIKPHLFTHLKHRISQILFYKSQLEKK